ncbi:MAG: hypothetical protein HAW61_00840 [Candidatus Portiera sp.]|nr:hypothetical protein [Portiera sp.]
MNKVSYATIGFPTKDKMKQLPIIAWNMDQAIEDEETTDPLLITPHNKNKDHLYEYLKMDKWPSCDYLHISINEKSKEDKVNLYLIEQKDILQSIKARMDNPSMIKHPKKVVEYLEKHLNIHDENDQEDALHHKIEILVDLVIYNLLEECRKKFFASLSVIFRLQMEKSISDKFPKNQIYHFVLLNIPKDEKPKDKEYIDEEDIEVVAGTTQISRIIERKIKEYEEDINTRIKGYLQDLKMKSKPPEIIIGTAIYGFGDLIRSINRGNGL